MRRGLWEVLGRGRLGMGFWWVNLRERDKLEYLDRDGRIILKCTFKI
jgi:hypothetical protein